MSAYEGEFIYLFQHYFSSDRTSGKNLMTVGNIAQKPRDVTVNRNIPSDRSGVGVEVGGGILNFTV